MATIRRPHSSPPRRPPLATVLLRPMLLMLVVGGLSVVPGCTCDGALDPTADAGAGEDLAGTDATSILDSGNDAGADPVDAGDDLAVPDMEGADAADARPDDVGGPDAALLDLTIAVRPSAVTVPEGGPASATVNFAVGHPPTAPVFVSLSASEAGQVTIQPEVVMLSAQQLSVDVILEAVDDSFAEGVHTVDVVTADAVSDDANYDEISVADIVVTIVDDDEAGFVVNPTTLRVLEGMCETFEISVTSAPIDPVEVTVNNLLPGELTVAPATVMFDDTNWATPTTVTVCSLDDPDPEGPESTTLTWAVGSAGPDYAGLTPDSVDVTIIDDDAAIVVDPTVLVVTEGGQAETFDVSITVPPTGNLTIQFATTFTEVTLNPTMLVFPAGTNVLTQSVTVEAVDDVVVDGTSVVSVTGNLVNPPPEYAGAPIDTVAVTVNDND